MNGRFSCRMLECFPLFAASQSKAEMQAAVWKMPMDFDSSIGEDNAANAPTLELLTKLESEVDYGDVKRYVIV